MNLEIRKETRKKRKEANVKNQPHSLEVSSITFLSSHHQVHGGPLRHVDRLDHPGYLVHERDRAGDVVEDLHVSNLLPRHRHVLEQLEHGVRHVLESAQVDTLVVSELLRRHVTMVFDDLADVF